MEVIMSKKEPFAQFLDFIVERLKSECTFIKNPENIIIGETVGLDLLSDEDFPRIEILIKKDKGNGYIGQRLMNSALRIDIGCHARREQDDYTVEDMYENIRFGTEVKKIIYKLHNAKLSGTHVCDGFQQMSGFPEVFYEHEIAPKISTAIVVTEAEIQLDDIHSTN